MMMIFVESEDGIEARAGPGTPSPSLYKGTLSTSLPLLLLHCFNIMSFIIIVMLVAFVGAQDYGGDMGGGDMGE
jgi:hypothetical protein